MGNMNITYNLEMEEPHTHFFKVTMDITDFTDNTMLITMPAWTPGSYEIVDFARHVRNVEAINKNGETLEVSKRDKSTWKVECGENREVSVKYEVYADKLSVHTSHLDSSHGYLNGTSVFMYIEGYKDQTSELLIRPYKDWKISTGLEKVGENRFRAINYDILVDCPIEIGNHRSLFFSVDGKEHEIAVYGSGNEDEDKLVNDFNKIVESFRDVFKGLPYRRYVFIIHLLPENENGGGLEHLNSTTIDIDRFIFSPKSRYNLFLSVVSHEFFHLWNVKRIRPIELGPFNYKQENYTTLLWMAEGFTNFYGWMILYRSGLIDQKEYFKHLAESIKMYELQPGAKKVSVSDSSFDSWIKLYKPTANNVNSYVSYYLKGELVGLLLHLRIIELTNAQKSLDDLYRFLNEKFKKDGKGYSEKDIVNALKDVTGQDFTDFFNDYVRNPGKLDFDRELKKLGQVIKRGYNKVDDVEPETKAYLGVLVRPTGGKFVVDSVLEGSPAYEYGLNAKDEILAINNFRFSERFLKNIREEYKKLKMDDMNTFKVGEKVTIHLFRRDKLEAIDLLLDKSPAEVYEILQDSEPVKGSDAVREKFFKG